MNYYIILYYRLANISYIVQQRNVIDGKSTIQLQHTLQHTFGYSDSNSILTRKLQTTLTTLTSVSYYRSSGVWFYPGNANKQLRDSLNSAKRIGKRQHMFANSCVKYEYIVRLPLLSVFELEILLQVLSRRRWQHIIQLFASSHSSQCHKSLKNRDAYLRP